MEGRNIALIIFGKCGLATPWATGHTKDSGSRAAGPKYNSPPGIADTVQKCLPTATKVRLNQYFLGHACVPFRPCGAISTERPPWSLPQGSSAPSAPTVCDARTLQSEMSHQWNLLQQMTQSKGGFVMPGAFYKSCCSAWQTGIPLVTAQPV